MHRVAARASAAAVAARRPAAAVAARAPARGAATGADAGAVKIVDATKADVGVVTTKSEPVSSPPRKPEAHAGSSSGGASSSSSGGGFRGAISAAWQRATAFVAGVGVASAFLYTTVRRDIEASTAAVEGAVAGVGQDAAEASRALSLRVAVLEHAVATLQRDAQGRST